MYPLIQCEHTYNKKRLFSLQRVIELRKNVLICLRDEKARSAVALVTRNAKYIFNSLSTSLSIPL